MDGMPLPVFDVHFVQISSAIIVCRFYRDDSAILGSSKLGVVVVRALLSFLIREKSAWEGCGSYSPIITHSLLFSLMLQPEEEGGEEKPTEAADPPAEAPAADASAEKVDIDLNDPEVQAAAVKIQASVKGYLTRKDLKNKEGKQGGEGEEAPPQE